MAGTGPEILWALTIGTISMLAVILLFIASIIFSQRKFITIEREKLDTLQQREERFRSLIENSNDGIVLLDGDFGITYASPSTGRITGYDPGEIVGKNFLSLIPPEDAESLHRGIGEIRRLKSTSSPMQFRLNHKDGRSMWIEGIAMNLLADPAVNRIVLNYRDITQRKEDEAELQNSNNQLRMLSARLQSIREEDRTRIAREIHDELGGMLTVLKMDLAVLEKNIGGPMPGASPPSRAINAFSAKIDSIVHAIRRIATELRPSVLDEFGLKEAIESELETFQARTGIESTLLSNAESFELDKDCSTALFRIFQETLTNIVRHARATEVEVSIIFCDGKLILRVQDNGRGISRSELSGVKSLGLLGMAERAHLIGGELTIEGEQGKGTAVTVGLPYPLRPQEAGQNSSQDQFHTTPGIPL